MDRCGDDIQLNPEKPRCRDCYEEWLEEGDEADGEYEYEESYCHMCGKEAEVYSSKPLCYSCYRSSR